MEGANLSGDLANPARSIPTGTLSAIATAITAYSLVMLSFGGSFDGETLRSVTTLPQNVSWGHFGYTLGMPTRNEYHRNQMPYIHNIQA